MIMKEWHDELARRMSGPQRHRLLQGYPMLPLMRPAVATTPKRRWPAVERRVDGELHINEDLADFIKEQNLNLTSEASWVQLDPSRPIIIGVLPHTQCNPQVEGCGFCTFPHDPYNKVSLRTTASLVEYQINSFFEEYPELSKRRVDAIYFGGATANLTPKAELSAICKALEHNLNLSNAEVTLEGIPKLFKSLLFRGTFEVLLDMPARHRRISMGVQTFDEPMLHKMGRAGFGNHRDVQRVVEKAHRFGLTASGDFLINLPSEPKTQMLDDVAKAAALGFDQICIYHLVLAEGHGTPWAENPAIRAALPSVEEACANWLVVREELLRQGYVQTTLTNFERADIHTTNRRFVYEEYSFTPEIYDAIGFGPLSISTFTDLVQQRAIKFVRSKSVNNTLWGRNDLFFPYDEEDLRLLFLTRRLVRLNVPRNIYRTIFGADLTQHFGHAIEAIESAGLVKVDEDALRLTPRGMFYADSIAGLLAWQRMEMLRASGAGRRTRDLLEEKAHTEHFMG